MHRLTTADELAEALRAPQLLLFKHSTMCPVSGFALQELATFAAEHPELPVYLIDVHAQRALSNDVAAWLEVRHESPQALLLRDGELVWHASHFGVTKGKVEAVLEEAW